MCKIGRTMRLRASLTFQDKGCCREPCSASGSFFTLMTGSLEKVDPSVGPIDSDTSSQTVTPTHRQ